MSRGSSLTSSRSRVPPFASWNFPAWRSVAPVKLPFSWPNRRDSTSASGMAPQFTATKGRPARSDEPCTARATTSLPTPLSPEISTGIEDRAARSPILRTWTMAADVPTRSLKVVLPSARLRSWATSERSAPMDRALWIEMVMRSGDAGLTKKSVAPACMAWTTVSIPPEAVSTMTGCWWARDRSSERVSRPERPGMTRSSRIRSQGEPDARRASRASPPSRSAAVKPSRSRTAWISRLWVGSSSTTTIVLLI